MNLETQVTLWTHRRDNFEYLSQNLGLASFIFGLVSVPFIFYERYFILSVPLFLSSTFIFCRIKYQKYAELVIINKSNLL